MEEAILVAENARAQSKDVGERTAYDCVVIGFSVGPAPLRECATVLRPRRNENP